jgi:hypothetical protein
MLRRASLAIFGFAVLLAGAACSSGEGTGGTGGGTGGSPAQGSSSSSSSGGECPLDCIGGEYITNASGCTCRYYQCPSNGGCDADGYCFRNNWICGDRTGCADFAWDTISCATYLTCQNGDWVCAP